MITDYRYLRFKNYKMTNRQSTLILHVCECTVGVDVGDGPTTVLKLILSNVVMGCIVLEMQMNVYFTMIVCPHTTVFVGMDVRFCTMKIHDSMIICPQTILPIVVDRAIVQCCF
jgi:hypothetical protein